jgi:ubiquinone/menaquinone biosynthesis C-methylase UbiE
MTTAPTPPLWPGETMASGGVDAPAPPPRASLRAAFDAMAPEYDDLRAPWYRHSLSVIDGVLAELAPPTAARPPRALDVGCGTGIQSLRLAAQGYRVMGVDLSPRLLDIARAKLAAAGHDAVFVEGDAVSLPVADASVDVVNCCGPALSLVPRWVDALREIARCLRPGGSLLLEVEGKWNLDAFWGSRAPSAATSSVTTSRWEWPCAISCHPGGKATTWSTRSSWRRAAPCPCPSSCSRRRK